MSEDGSLVFPRQVMMWDGRGPEPVFHTHPIVVVFLLPFLSRTKYGRKENVENMITLSFCSHQLGKKQSVFNTYAKACSSRTIWGGVDQRL